MKLLERLAAILEKIVGLVDKAESTDEVVAEKDAIIEAKEAEIAALVEELAAVKDALDESKVITDAIEVKIAEIEKALEPKEVVEPVVEVEPQNEEMLIDDIVNAVENGDDSVLVKPSINPTVEVIKGQPIVTELKPKATRKVEEKPNNNTVTLVDILDVADEFKLGHKTNKTHIVLKAKKNIMEVYYSSKKHTCYVVIKHQCVDAVPNIKEELIMNYEGKIVGAGTYTLDFKFRVDTVDQLKQAISLAVNY